MAFLEQFSADERNLLVTLPYRAGCLVSLSDETGGLEADVREIKALGKIIEAKRGSFDSAFVQEVMAETFDRKDEWKSWAVTLESVPDDCRLAMRLLSGKLERKDVDLYRECVMSVATEVALAFREFDADAAFPAKLWTAFKLRLDKLVGKLRGEAYETEKLLNISYEEDLMLAKLSEALHSGINDHDEDQAVIGKSV